MGNNKNDKNGWGSATKISLIYVVFSAVWFLVSDELLAFVVHDVVRFTRLHTLKDWFFVIVTAALLFWLIRRQLLVVYEKEQYNRDLFEESVIGLALCRMNGELIDINPAYARIIGRSVEEAMQISYWGITPEEYFGEDKQQLEILKQTGRFGPYEKEYVHKDGYRVPVRLSGRILKKGVNVLFYQVWKTFQSAGRQKRILLILPAVSRSRSARFFPVASGATS